MAKPTLAWISCRLRGLHVFVKLNLDGLFNFGFVVVNNNAGGIVSGGSVDDVTANGETSFWAADAALDRRQDLTFFRDVFRVLDATCQRQHFRAVFDGDALLIGAATYDTKLTSF